MLLIGLLIGLIGGATAQSCATICAVGTLRAGDNCLKCQYGMVCEEENLDVSSLTLDSGFWRPTNASINVTQCFPTDNCLGGAKVGDDSCAFGFRGFACGYCDGGRRFFGRSCVKCTVGEYEATLGILGGLLLICPCVYLLCTGTHSTSKVTIDLTLTWVRPPDDLQPAKLGELICDVLGRKVDGRLIASKAVLSKARTSMNDSDNRVRWAQQEVAPSRRDSGPPTPVATQGGGMASEGVSTQTLVHFRLETSVLSTANASMVEDKLKGYLCQERTESTCKESFKDCFFTSLLKDEDKEFFDRFRGIFTNGIEGREELAGCKVAELILKTDYAPPERLRWEENNAGGGGKFSLSFRKSHTPPPPLVEDGNSAVQSRRLSSSLTHDNLSRREPIIPKRHGSGASTKSTRSTVLNKVSQVGQLVDDTTGKRFSRTWRFRRSSVQSRLELMVYRHDLKVCAHRLAGLGDASELPRVRFRCKRSCGFWSRTVRWLASSPRPLIQITALPTRTLTHTTSTHARRSDDPSDLDDGARATAVA